MSAKTQLRTAMHAPSPPRHHPHPSFFLMDPSTLVLCVCVCECVCVDEVRLRLPRFLGETLRFELRVEPCDLPPRLRCDDTDFVLPRLRGVRSELLRCRSVEEECEDVSLSAASSSATAAVNCDANSGPAYSCSVVPFVFNKRVKCGEV